MNSLAITIRPFLIPPVLVVFFLVIDVVLVSPPHISLARFTSAAAWPGWVVITFALLLIIAAVLQMLLQRTTVDPLHLDKTQTLITSGLFRLSRNPIYLGFALLLLGVALVLKSLIAGVLVALFMLTMTWLHIRIEEQYLSQKFGSTWAQYTRRTRRWL
ncbi:isoprenylcysteine carboxylmethyltransferase family protein [Enterobacteriaceae bacterium 4M9]|nr:isoprenylcysteine carboxylmethyltransferase family protein [Enterobacteriaceae bacterium 4M9]